MVTVEFQCSGCDAKAPGTKPIGARFVSITGRSYGFGSVVIDQVSDVVPDGWVWPDPITRVTYCEECWRGIVGEIEERANANDQT